MPKKTHYLATWISCSTKVFDWIILGEVVNYSSMERLGETFFNLEQVTVKRKLKIDSNS